MKDLEALGWKNVKGVIYERKFEESGATQMKIQRLNPILPCDDDPKRNQYAGQMEADSNGQFVRYSDVQPFLEPRPISEAPKDGTHILAFTGYRWVVVQWTQSPTIEAFCGWQIECHEDICFVTPTHFLPLPPVGEQG